MINLRLLCLGDVVGKPGRIALKNHLPQIQNDLKVNFTIVNIENAAGGHGLTTKIYQELNHLDIQAYTSGNHIYNKKEAVKDFFVYEKLVRPLNYPQGNPGVGYRIYNYNGIKIGVVNLVGRVFMGLADCPFQIITKFLPEITRLTDLIIVDFHAETTSEKQAMGWYLDGKVTAVFGTHTHIITADEKILPAGTAYITDIGMVGAEDSVIGMSKEPIIERFLTQLPIKFEPPIHGGQTINGIVMDIEIKTKKVVSITRFQRNYQ
ncbi:MAG: TIGR00282 family metallophosphoesterase [Candidatus Margulisiibacteriota bacterium]|jgi:hypothetical protein